MRALSDELMNRIRQSSISCGFAIRFAATPFPLIVAPVTAESRTGPKDLRPARKFQKARPLLDAPLSGHATICPKL